MSLRRFNVQFTDGLAVSGTCSVNKGSDKKFKAINIFKESIILNRTGQVVDYSRLGSIILEDFFGRVYYCRVVQTDDAEHFLAHYALSLERI